MKINVSKAGELPGHRDSIYTLSPAESPDHFFSSGGDGLIVKWDLSALDKPGKVIAQLPSPVYSLIYLPEKEQILAGSRSGMLYLFNLSPAKLEKEIQLQGEIFVLKNTDQGCIVAGTGNGLAYIINIHDLSIIKELRLSDKSCRSIALSPGKKNIATGWSDAAIRIIDTNTFAIKEIPGAHETSVFSLAYHPAGNYLLSGGRDAHLKIRELPDYSLMLDIPAHWYAINEIEFSPDGQLFATASRDKTVRIWETESFELIRTLDKDRLEGHTHSVNTLLWMQHANYLLSAGDDRKIEVWRIEKE